MFIVMLSYQFLGCHIQYHIALQHFTLLSLHFVLARSPSHCPLPCPLPPLAASLLSPANSQLLLSFFHVFHYPVSLLGDLLPPNDPFPV